MAKNQQAPKNTPQVKQVQSAVKSKTNTNKGGSWLQLPDNQNATFLFDKINYIILGVGALLIIIGFIMMSGGNTDPKVFNEAEIYSFRRITLAPITVITGFIVIIIAILKKPSTATEV